MARSRLQRSGSSLKQIRYYNNNDNKISRFCSFLTKLLEQFWTRWRQEYLTELRVQHRNDSTKGQSIALNDVVLVHDDKLPRSLWRIGKVVELITSQDNKVRGVQVRLPNSSILKRPVNKLYPIEYSPYNDDNNNNVSKPVNQVETDKNDGQSTGVLRRSRREAAIVGDIRRKYLM